MGRPSLYTDELAAEICGLIAEGNSLRSICRMDEMPEKTTVFRLLAKHEEFRNQYACAREAQADAMAEEILEIADDGSNDTYEIEEGVSVTNHDVIARSRLRVDARKWLASKMAPKKYGDKIAHTGPDGGAIESVTRIEYAVVDPK